MGASNSQAVALQRAQGGDEEAFEATSMELSLLDEMFLD